MNIWFLSVKLFISWYVLYSVSYCHLVHCYWNLYLFVFCLLLRVEINYGSCYTCLSCVQYCQLRNYCIYIVTCLYFVSYCQFRHCDWCSIFKLYICWSWETIIFDTTFTARDRNCIITFACLAICSGWTSIYRLTL